MGPVLGGWLYGFVLNLLLIFSGSLLVITIVYILMVYKNVKRRKEVESKRTQWEEWLRESKKGEVDREFWKKNIDKKEESFGNFLIEKTRKGDQDLKFLKDVYINLGFVKEDIERLNSDKWYKKTKTLERWKHLDLLPKEKDVLNLLTSQNNAVRLAALDLIAHHQHPGLGKNVKMIFDFYSEHVDDYLLVKLMIADISIEDLQKLTQTDEYRLKRAGVVLLGRVGEKDSIKVLKELEKGDENIRYEIARSLGRIRTVEVVELLDMMRGDDSPKVRREVARSLGRIFQEAIIDDSWEKLIRALYDREQTIKILEELLEDEEHEVRVAAFLALSNLEEKGREIINKYRDKYPSLAREALLRSFSGGVRYDAI